MPEKIFVVMLFKNSGQWGGHSSEVKSYHASLRSAECYVRWYEESLERSPGVDYSFFIREEELIVDEGDVFMLGLS